MDMKKQTGDHMKETVLLYGFKDQERSTPCTGPGWAVSTIKQC